MADTWGTTPAAPEAATTDEWSSAPAETAEETPAETAEESTKLTAPDLSKEEFVQKARGAGWTETTAFNYEEFARLGGADAEWHGTSKVYEWKDEFGDVGPVVPELEHILFGGEFMMRKGEHFRNLQLKVDIEGPAKIDPVRSVSQLTQNTYRYWTCPLTNLSVRGGWLASCHDGEHQAVLLCRAHSDSVLHHSGCYPGHGCRCHRADWYVV